MRTLISASFAVLAAGAAHAQVSWGPTRTISVPFGFFPEVLSSPAGGDGYASPDWASVMLDLDGDGDLDVVLATSLNVGITHGPKTPLYFLENDGHGNLTRNDAKFLEGSFPGMETYRQICVIDANKDGRLDLLIESTGYEGDYPGWLGERTRLLLAQSSGRLKDVTDTNMPAHRAFAHQGSCQNDLNGDGVPDYYQHTLDGMNKDPNLQFNTGDGHYVVVADLGTDFSPSTRLVGTNTYIDPDHLRCIGRSYITASVKPAPYAPANLYWGQVAVPANLPASCPSGRPPYLQIMLINDGTGHFTVSDSDLPSPPWPKTGDNDGAEPNNLKVGDIDDDGDDDLVLLMNPNADHGTVQSVYLLKQTAPGHFVNWTNEAFVDSSPTQTGPGGGAVFLVDVNGDGAPDIYTQKANPGFQGYSPRLWLNDGYGRFHLAQEFTLDAGVTVAIGDLDGDGWAELLSSKTNVTPGVPGPSLLSTSLHGPAPASIVGAIAPLTRSVQSGQTATAFATIVNASDKPLFGCRIKPPRTRASTFSFQATDPATNAPVGSPNAEMTIPPNGVQSFVFAVSVSGDVNGEDLQIQLDCRNTKDAPRIDGLSMFRLSSSTGAAKADIVPIAVAPSGDGVMRLNQAGRTGFFAAAAVNIGAAGQITIKPAGTTTLPATLTLCETGAGGACLAPPSPQVTSTFAANQTKTFSVFGVGSADIAPDYANKRVLLDFTDAGSSLVGRASVAITTNP